MKSGTRCAGTLGRRLPGAGRQCPVHTKHESGLCAMHRAAAVQKAAGPVLRAAEEWHAARTGGWVLDRLEAEERLQEAVAALREVRAGR